MVRRPVKITPPNNKQTEDMSSLLKEAGYKVKEFNLINPGESGRYNPTNGKYNIFGDGKKEFVEKLAAICKLNIIEENNAYIQIEFTEKENTSYSLDELQKKYYDFVTLLNSMENAVEIISASE